MPETTNNIRKAHINAIFIFVIALFFMVLEPILAQSVQSKTKLKAADFCQKYKCTPNAVLLDARPVHSKPPHDSTLITGAIRVPEKYMLQSVLDTVGFDRPIFVFCSEGKRSETIVAILVQKHYQKVYQLDGGLDLCLKKGFNPGKTIVKKTK